MLRCWRSAEGGKKEGGYRTPHSVAKRTVRCKRQTRRLFFFFSRSHKLFSRAIADTKGKKKEGGRGNKSEDPPSRFSGELLFFLSFLLLWYVLISHQRREEGCPTPASSQDWPRWFGASNASLAVQLMLSTYARVTRIRGWELGMAAANRCGDNICGKEAIREGGRKEPEANHSTRHWG